jgi:probable rRNA maturation factor
MGNLIEVKITSKFPFGQNWLKEKADFWLKKRGKNNAHLEIEVVGTRRIAALNKKFLHRMGPTDVLSFPLPSNKLLGTIFLCGDIIKKNAKENEKTLENEFEFILRHGIDHIVGIHH